VESGEPLVSVIVPVRDNGRGVRELLRALTEQTLPPERFEIVIGDDGSSVDPPAQAERRDGRVQIVRLPPHNSYAARNRAVRAAGGDVLAFCASDCLPEPTWLEEGLTALERADLVAGEVTFVAPPRTTVWSLLTMDMFLDQERAVRRSRAVTANLFVRRQLFDRLGGFAESFPSGADYDFALRAVERHARLAYAPQAVVRHPTLDDPARFLRKVWLTNRWDAARRALAGERPSAWGILALLPPIGVAVARRQSFRPVAKLHAPRLEAAGIRPTWRDHARALPVLYFPVAITAGAARTRGWVHGLRLVRARAPRG
jgi:glycosyltransferase involved in cell wall biosynthesis